MRGGSFAILQFYLEYCHVKEHFCNVPNIHGHPTSSVHLKLCIRGTGKLVCFWIVGTVLKEHFFALRMPHSGKGVIPSQASSSINISSMISGIVSHIYQSPSPLCDSRSFYSSILGGHLKTLFLLTLKETVELSTPRGE